jgi:hypothetical protein
MASRGKLFAASADGRTSEPGKTPETGMIMLFFRRWHALR